MSASMRKRKRAMVKAQDRRMLVEFNPFAVPRSQVMIQVWGLTRPRRLGLFNSFMRQLWGKSK